MIWVYAGPKPERIVVDERATAYVCRGRSCSLPVTEPDALAVLLQSRSVAAPP